MLYGRRLDQSLEHVDGSRYALVHAVAQRARQITLWLTADPAELRAESAPPPAPGELVTRDPVALAEAEILDGEVRVRWDPEGLGEDADAEELGLETDPLLIEGLDDGDEVEGGDLSPALAQVLDEGDGESETSPTGDADATEGDGDAPAVSAAEATDGEVTGGADLEDVDVEENGEDDGDE